jgi:hypothetical protein
MPPSGWLWGGPQGPEGCGQSAEEQGCSTVGVVLAAAPCGAAAAAPAGCSAPARSGRALACQSCRPMEHAPAAAGCVGSWNLFKGAAGRVGALHPKHTSTPAVRTHLAVAARGSWRRIEAPAMTSGCSLQACGASWAAEQAAAAWPACGWRSMQPPWAQASAVRHRAAAPPGARCCSWCPAQGWEPGRALMQGRQPGGHSRRR